MQKALYFSLLMCLIANNVNSYDDNDDRVRVWQPVEHNGVDHRLYRFLDEYGITHCSEFMEEPRLLRLRCLSDNELFDVDVFIYRRNPEKLAGFSNIMKNTSDNYYRPSIVVQHM